MVQTNEFERDLNNQVQLKRPGRVDMVVFQNIPDAGDGHPGIQRCFRNYLHEGGFEKDLDLVGYAIKGTSVNISNAEMQQLSNIGGAEINGTQWGYVGGADQPVKISDSPTFGGLTLTGDLALDTGARITSADEDLTFSFGRTKLGSPFADFATFAHVDNLTQSNYAIRQQSNGATFINSATGTAINFCINNATKIDLTTSILNMSVPISMGSNAITTNSTVDGVDVSAHDHSGSDKGVAVPFSSLSGDITYPQLDSIVDTSGGGTGSMISHAQHVHTAGDGSSKISHDNLTSASVSANDHHPQSHAHSTHSGIGDNDHHPQTHNHNGETLQFDDINSNGGTFDFITSGVLNLKTNGDATHYLEISNVGGGMVIKGVSDFADEELTFWCSGAGATYPMNFICGDEGDHIKMFTVSSIPYMGIVGGTVLYFANSSGGNWVTVHADAFTIHSEPLPIGNSTDEILAIKNKDGKLDHKSLPSNAYFIDKNNENEGMSIGAVVLHLVKMNQELEKRIKDLEGL